MLCFKCLKDIPERSARCPSCGQNFSGKGASLVERGPALKEGDKIGHYVVRELIGEGPVGRVYKVLDPQFDVIAAVKLFYPEFASHRGIRAKTVEVYRGLIEFESESYVKIFDAGEDGNRLFVAQDYVEGLSLRRLIEVRSGTGGKFTFEEIEPILEGIGTAIEALQPGEVHGNLKPENIIIHPDAVKLTDLGLTRIMEPAEYVAAQVVGGNPYLAPELAQNPDRLLTDPAIDVYAAGAIVFQLLTGTLPLAGAISPKALEPSVSKEIDALVTKALLPDPDQRFAHLAEFHLAVAHLLKKLEVAARLEIFLHDVPPRPPFKVAAPPPPPPPPAPAAPQPAARVVPANAKSLFDDDIMGGGEDKTKKAPPASVPLPPPAKSKMPLFAGAGLLLVIVLAVAFFMLRGKQEEAVSVAAVAAKVDAHEKQAEAKAAKAKEVKTQAEEAVARAEKSRENAIAVNAEKDAPDLFIAGMKAIRVATDALRDKEYATAQSAAVDAERTFADAIIKGVENKQSAQAKQAVKEEKAKTAAVTASLQAPAKPKEPCPEGMVHVRSGTFIMGAPSNDADRNPGEKYNETTSVSSYCIDKYEYPNRKGGKPVSGVSWGQAKASCEKEQKRLCTETEWEKACKGPNNQKFPYAMSFDANKCNTEDGNGDDRKIAASGSFAACVSGYGVNDMSGNVWEWTESKLQSNLPDRVLRGGSFTRPDYHDRCANRYNSLPSVADSEFGFRCCAEASD